MTGAEPVGRGVGRVANSRFSETHDESFSLLCDHEATGDALQILLLVLPNPQSDLGVA